jgi:transaldolase/glucose-6-phosphate isomerase
MSNVIQETLNLGQAVWLDYIRRGLLTSGEFQQFVEQGISGVTSNPTIFEKAMVGSTDYDEALLALAKAGKNAIEIYEALAIEDIRAAADLLRPVYDRTSGKHGYASLEVSPMLAYNTDGTIEEARRLYAALNRPNVMVKVPATLEGIPAIRQLISEGININVTLIFSLDRHIRVMEAYIAGLEELLRAGSEVSRVASVASFFLSRVDTAVDALLEERIRQGAKGLKTLLGKAAIANAKLAYQAFKHTFGQGPFTLLRSKGAQVQRPLWASTGTKNPAYSDLLYVEQLIGSDTVNTMPPATITALLEHGRVEATIELGVTESEQALTALGAAEISMEAVTDKLLADGVRAFADSFEKLLAGIEQKKARLLTGKHIHLGASLGKLLPEVEAALADLGYRGVVRRIWKRDHTAWKPNPAEITNRLGWLNVTDIMHEQVPALEAFAKQMKNEGFRKIVLLGMGGSSLGPEVIRETYGSATGYPELIVLDSTVPSSVKAVSDAIDPEHTLFLVSSKSGTTIEPLLLLRYFKNQVESAIGKGQAGRNFVAITDFGTPLTRLAQEEGFRHTFLNPQDIGGRYSVLSYIGLVPASLMGIDVTMLLERAERMREGCASCVPLHENPGAWLGVALGALALRGHDKLTLVTSPSISSFGLWVEQLIAESTGKEGKGIIPVAGEPLVELSKYGDDRLFIYMRLKSDNNSSSDSAIENIKSAGHPILVLEMQDRYDLGAEFFRWEFATAVAGAMLGINPFDQPNVQMAKDTTQSMLQSYLTSGHLPRVDVALSLSELSAKASKGKYMAIMAYIDHTPDVNAVLTEFRRRLIERYSIATTLGYGPRFLHSTGQLHKGGPDTGLFIQITTDHATDMSIHGAPYSFGVVADAQALGDLQALQSLGRSVTKVHLRQIDRETIGQLYSLLL